MAEFFGLVRETAHPSGAEVWVPSYSPEDMMRPSSEYIPCSTWGEGVKTLRAMYPGPAGETHLSRVFTTTRDGESYNKAAVLPRPMLHSLHRPDRTPVQEQIDRFRKILADPACGGVFYLPQAYLVQRLLGQYRDNYGRNMDPRVQHGEAYNDTTPDSFCKWMRADETFRASPLVFGRTESDDYILTTVRVDPQAALKRAKYAAARAKAVATKQRNADEKTRQVREAEERKQAVRDRWHALATASNDLWTTIPELKDHSLSYSYDRSRAMGHTAYRFHRMVRLHERLMGKGEWRKSAAVRDALVGLYGGRDQVNGKDDEEGGSWRNENPHVLTAVKWVLGEAARAHRVARRKQLKAERAAQKKGTKTPVPA